MPRPRFEKLPPETRAEFLRAAEEEFSRHPYNEASLNRIIEAAGSNKGRFYYYFENKRDVFESTLRAAFSDYTQSVFPGLIPTAPIRDVAAFWQTIEGAFQSVFDYWIAHPEKAALMRRVLDSGAQAMEPFHEFREQATVPLKAMVSLGQQVGAVRTDVVPGLMLRMLISILETVDVWVLERLPDEGAAKLKRELLPVAVDALRRLATPEKGGE